MGKLKPSLAVVWLNCPKSPVMCDGIKNEETVYTSRGNALHAEAAKALQTIYKVAPSAKSVNDEGKISYPLTSESMGDVRQYTIFVRDSLKGMFGNEPIMPLIETKIPLSFCLHDQNGIVDFAAYNEKALLVLDYKTGYKKISAYDNPQLYLYALGMMEMLKQKNMSPKEICVGICQPSQANYPLVSFHSYELNDWLDAHAKAIDDAYYDRGEYNPGWHCAHCYGRMACKAYLLYKLKGGKQNEESEDD